MQDIIKKGLSRDHSKRPTMSEVCKALDEFASMSMGVEDCDTESTSTSSSTRKQLVFPTRLSSKRGLREFGSSFNSAVSATETSGTTADTCDSFLLQEVRDDLLPEVGRTEHSSSLHSLDETNREEQQRQITEGK